MKKYNNFVKESKNDDILNSKNLEIYFNLRRYPRGTFYYYNKEFVYYINSIGHIKINNRYLYTDMKYKLHLIYNINFKVYDLEFTGINYTIDGIIN